MCFDKKRPNNLVFLPSITWGHRKIRGELDFVPTSAIRCTLLTRTPWNSEEICQERKEDSWKYHFRHSFDELQGNQ